jgi:hypothetical protein
MGLSGQGHVFSVIPREKYAFMLYKKLVEPHGRLYKKGGEKNFTLRYSYLRNYNLHNPLGKQNKYSDSVDGNKWPVLGHCTNISVQTIHEQRNNHLVNFRIKIQYWELRHTKRKYRLLKARRQKMFV